MSTVSRKQFNSLEEIIAAHKTGTAAGIFSVCSSNPLVLEAAIHQARRGNRLLLVESTSNQVNQFGGYTGMNPTQFRSFVLELADRNEFPKEKLIIGGDHLGPNPWQREPEAAAMKKASDLVADCVRAGYTKIHLDASMQLADDPPDSLPPEVAARRGATLLQAAENAWKELAAGSPRPLYVIGSEVPPPGGASGPEGELEVTPVVRAQKFIELTRQSLHDMDLEEALERVIALVVQPGVEFGDESIHHYQREKAAPLSRYIESVPGIVYEAHSTDYQTPQALRQMVIDHFAILKVGPALTFAMREALFALEQIEQELAAVGRITHRSHLSSVLEEVMVSRPEYWQKYYSGTPAEQALKRRFSLSDRIRYYWPDSQVSAALERLFKNLSEEPLPLGLISQYLPRQAQRVISGEVAPQPFALVEDHICDVIRDYEFACGWQQFF